MGLAPAPVWLVLPSFFHFYNIYDDESYKFRRYAFAYEQADA